ncbi:sulfite exporter TauE/SafE family protein [Actinomycetota bacterium]
MLEAADAAIALAAGVGAGFVVSAVGAGSLVSFPLLLSIGLPPVAANVTNTVGLVPGGITGSLGFRRELAGHGALVKRVALTSGIGALLGAVLLLAAPSTVFDSVVPWLVLFAATLVGIQPLLSRWLKLHHRTEPEEPRLSGPLSAVATAIGVYGGYFGAGQGVMLVGFLALGLPVPMTVVNGLKNVAVLAANVVGSVIFILAGPIVWSVAALVAAGSFVGGWAGAHVGRRLPPNVFRALVVVFGYIVGIRLLLG